jgi:uncharacterized protein (UPF0332 family)
MSFAWNEYLKLASELAGEENDSPSNDEAKYRASISRAYYAAFHNAKKYYEAVKKVRLEGPSQHNEIKRWLEDTSHKVRLSDLETLSDYYTDVYNARINADYKQDFDEINRSLASSVVMQATTILDKIEKLIKLVPTN